MQLLPTKTNRDLSELIFLRLEGKLQFRKASGNWMPCNWSNDALLVDPTKRGIYDFRKKPEPEVVYKYSYEYSPGRVGHGWYQGTDVELAAAGHGTGQYYIGRKKFVEVMDDN